MFTADQKSKLSQKRTFSFQAVHAAAQAVMSGVHDCCTVAANLGGKRVFAMYGLADLIYTKCKVCQKNKLYLSAVLAEIPFWVQSVGRSSQQGIAEVLK